jgi:tRNA-uridine aminocarboxypropyltransferase
VARCWRCRRPGTLCWCARLVPVATATRVVFLQHPRERRVRIGTALLAHQGLANSELHLGVRFADHARVRRLVAAPGTALLFPGPGAHDPRHVPGAPPSTLIVLDGTWVQARKLLHRNPQLAALPRLGFVPAAPSRYRVRREPAPHCLSTIEAVVETLRRLEGDDPRLDALLGVFDDLVAVQLRCVADHPRPYHRESPRHAVEPPPLACNNTA